MSFSINVKATLGRVERNDITLDELSIGGYGTTNYGGFDSTDGNDYSTLGRFIGENTRLTKLLIRLHPSIALDVTDRGFFEGIKRNSSISELVLNCDGRGVVDELIYEILKAYHENNNLTRLCIARSDLQNGGDIAIAETLRGCTNLQEFETLNCMITDVQLTSLIEAVRGNTSLKILSFPANFIGTAGCEVLAALLEDPNCNLRTLSLGSNNINNDGATTLANSLSSNTKLKNLHLNGNPIDQSVGDIFARLFCNTSSINSIYSSNHTLERLVLSVPRGNDLRFLLRLNKGTNKSHVAIKKILKYHPNMNMEALFEWNMEGEGEHDLKALPYVIAWYKKAQEAVAGDEGGEESYNIDKSKLAAMYQFAQAMPLLFVPTSHIKVGDNKRKRDDK